MTEADAPFERIQDYLKNMSLQARKNLLAEIERMQMYGETTPGADVLLALLHAEFRGSGETHDRLGNPSRHFFQPIEALFVNRSAERTSPAQISRGSLSPIWEWISNGLLPTMARDYCDSMRDALVKGDASRARTIAHDFQSKVLKSLEGTLDTDEGIRRARNGLAQYTASQATFDDLMKVMAALRVRDALAKLSRALPPKIDDLHGKMLADVRGFLDAFAAEQEGEALPFALAFALAFVARHLNRRWQLIRLATSTAEGRGAAAIAASRFALSITIVLDHLDDIRIGLKQALRSDRVQVAKENLADIYEIETALRDEIGHIESSDWGPKLDGLMAQVAADLEAEFHRLPEGTHHVLASVHRHGHGTLTSLVRKGRDALRGLVSH
jgi:hypothetical protein